MEEHHRRPLASFQQMDSTAGADIHRAAAHRCSAEHTFVHLSNLDGVRNQVLAGRPLASEGAPVGCVRDVHACTSMAHDLNAPYDRAPPMTSGEPRETRSPGVGDSTQDGYVNPC